jgi:hypothetical protein
MLTKDMESAQKIMIQKIKESLPKSTSFVDEIADLLKISNDSAYRRIRGETALTIEEIALICKHFKFSFDTFINNNDDNFVTFAHHQLSSHLNTFEDYLQNMKNELSKMLKYAEHERHVIFAAEDVPVFQHFVHPYLTAFKMFYWNKSILNSTGYEGKKFEATLIDSKLLDLALDIYNIYSQISSVEIWSDDTANSTLKQIEFYWDAGVFKSKKDALLVCEEMRAMLERINRQAELNVKLDSNNKSVSTSNNYALYHSDLMIGNNCILASKGDVKETYISYHNFNFMLTTNAAFCNETELWLKNLIQKSNLISGVAEKHRYRYFKHIDGILNKLIVKIEND